MHGRFSTLAVLPPRHSFLLIFAFPLRIRLKKSAPAVPVNRRNARKDGLLPTRAAAGRPPRAYSYRYRVLLNAIVRYAARRSPPWRTRD